jgi:hypothetical protein
MATDGVDINGHGSLLIAMKEMDIAPIIATTMFIFFVYVSAFAFEVTAQGSFSRSNRHLGHQPTADLLQQSRLAP